MACGGSIQGSIGNAWPTLSHIACLCALRGGGELGAGHLLPVFLCETLMRSSTARSWLQSDWNVADLRASQSCESESKGDAHCPAWLKENDHFKIHNSQVPAVYSWEKPSELLFIKEREGSLAKKREKEVVCGNVQGIFRLNKWGIWNFSLVLKGLWREGQALILKGVGRGMPSWALEQLIKNILIFLEENSKITLPLYFYYLKLRKFSHLILNHDLRGSFPFLFQGCAIGVGIYGAMRLGNSCIWYRISVSALEVKAIRCFWGVFSSKVTYTHEGRRPLSGVEFPLCLDGWRTVKEGRKEKKISLPSSSRFRQVPELWESEGWWIKYSWLLVIVENWCYTRAT